MQSRSATSPGWALQFQRPAALHARQNRAGGRPWRCAAGREDGFTAVVFDMDGVLCDSEEITAKAAVKFFKDGYGVDAVVEDFYQFSGMGENIYLGKVAEKYGLDIEIESFKAAYYELYRTQYAVPGANIGYPGALDLIKECKKEGLKIALASSADRIKLEASLIAADIPIENFDFVVSGSDGIKNLKPSPDIFLKAANMLGVDPENCVVIEDSNAGVRAAKAAGMACLAVETSLPKDALVELAADSIIPAISQVSVADLTQAFNSWTDQDSEVAKS